MLVSIYSTAASHPGWSSVAPEVLTQGGGLSYPRSAPAHQAVAEGRGAACCQDTGGPASLLCGAEQGLKRSDPLERRKLRWGGTKPSARGTPARQRLYSQSHRLSRAERREAAQGQTQRNVLQETFTPRPKEHQEPALPKLAIDLKLKEELKVMLKKAPPLKEQPPC